MASRVIGGQKLDRFFREAKRATGVRSVEVGFFATARYPDGTPVAAVAAWNEFGTDNIPERPFFRQAIKLFDKPLVQLLKAELDPKTMRVDRRLAGRLGAVMVGILQKRITDLRSPPNAPSTIARKGSSNPLIDTGQMRQAATWKVNG